MSLNLSKIVTSAIATLSKSVDGVVKSVVYKAVSGQPAYDPETGTIATTTVDYNISNAVLVGYTRREREFDFQQSRRVSVEAGDQKCLIPYSSLPISPGGEDYISIDGVVWRVISHSLDPSGTALHTFQIRRA